MLDQVAEILKDRPSWYRDCRAVDVLNVMSTGNGGTIELMYMQVIIFFTSSMPWPFFPSPSAYLYTEYLVRLMI